MTNIPIVEVGWEYSDVYPCDTQFIEYLSGLGLEKMNTAVIFHMGPGLHHKVGLWAVEQSNIFVRSISITPSEVKEYINLATENPWLARKYMVDFGDIHLINANILPRFDFISLFHLGEISEQVLNPDYPGNAVEGVLNTMTKKLSVAGEILFYEKSAAWEKIKTFVEIHLSTGYNYKMTQFKDLVIFKKEVK